MIPTPRTLRLPWQLGLAGNCNIVVFDGDDITGVAYVPSEEHAKTLINMHNALLAAEGRDERMQEKDSGAGLGAVENDTGSSPTETASSITIPEIDGPCPMTEPTFDGEYPSDETLVAIEHWPASQINACLEFVRAAWHWEDRATEELKPHEREMVHAEEGERFLRLATGGWSGNEDLIAALERNLWARQQWLLSSRGGLHIFEFKSLADNQPSTEVSSPPAALKAQTQVDLADAGSPLPQTVEQAKLHLEEAISSYASVDVASPAFGARLDRVDECIDALIVACLPNAETVAELFHQHYEQLAPHFGYATRPETQVPWGRLPEANRQLMIRAVECAFHDLRMPWIVSRQIAAKESTSSTSTSEPPS